LPRRESLDSHGKKFALPGNAVLCRENPMILFGEEEQLAFYPPKLCGLKRLECLAGRDPVVPAPLNDEDGRIPFCDQVAGIVSAVGVLRCGVGCVPVRAAVIPIDKPQLFRGAVHALQVEDSVVGYESLESLLVNAGQIKYGIPAIARSHASEPILVDIGLL